MANNLVTLNEFKDYAGISSDDKDSRLKTIIAFSSDFIKQYCSRVFVDNHNGAKFLEIVEYWSGGFTHYDVKEYPIVSVESVEFSTDLGVNYTNLIEGTDYAWDREKDAVYIVTASDYNSPNTYKITYTGGYSTTTLPTSLKAATLDLIHYYYKQETAPRKSSGSIAIEYITNADLPPHIKRVLDLYRKL